VATLTGTSQTSTYGASEATLVRRGDPEQTVRTFELHESGGRYLVADVRRAGPAEAPAPAAPAVEASFRLTDVARSVGLDFHHGAFRFGMSVDTGAMMGGGLCWLDFDGDGWMDLYVVNSYAESDIARYLARGGLPRSRLYRNVHGHFVDVTRRAGAGLAMRGTGCVAADLDGNGTTDLFVTTANFDPGRNAYDALLWNNGDGTFTEGAAAAGIDEPGWHSGAAAADVNGDGRLDLFVAGYTDVNHALPGSQQGFPANHAGVPDALYLNEAGSGGHASFRDAGRAAGLEPHGLDHGLGAVFTDVNGDGRPDLYVANDLDPNRLYLNERTSGPLGFRFVEEGRKEHVDDPNAGMGIAVGDYSGDGREDLFVTNSRGQLHAVYRARAGLPYADARPDFVDALGQQYTGWGASWADLDLDGSPELAMANGAIPVTNLAQDAQRLRVLSTDDGTVRALATGPSEARNGRGLAAADFDNDGDLDLAVNSVGGALQLFRNDGATGHWLAVGGLEPGAVVTAVLPDGRRLVREMHAGSSYLSTEDPRASFGLGGATRVSALVVRRPDGTTTRLRDVAADRLVTPRSLSVPARRAARGAERLEHDLDQRVRGEDVLPRKRARGGGAACADRLADRAVLEVVLRVELVELGPRLPHAVADERPAGALRDALDERQLGDAVDHVVEGVVRLHPLDEERRVARDPPARLVAQLERQLAEAPLDHVHLREVVGRHLRRGDLRRERLQLGADEERLAQFLRGDRAHADAAIGLEGDEPESGEPP
jgi:hypothetical protein